MPDFIFRAVIVDGETDVVLLYEFFDARQSLRCGVAGDNDADPRALAVFKFGADVRIFIFGKIDGAGSVKGDPCRGVIREGGGFLLRVHREMIFDVLAIEREDVELLQEGDHLRARKIPERVASNTEANRRGFVGRWGSQSRCEHIARRSENSRNERTGANEIAAG